MSYKLDFSAQSQKDISFHRKSGNKFILKKLLVLLEEVSETPFEGMGKPEPLKHNFSGYWSRRINGEHRLVYQVNDDVVQILSVKGHYK
jgi:toxin YoeB